MPRIAVGGFQHETNTFAPTKADLNTFLEDGAWPGLCEGEAIFTKTAGINLPVAGFVEAAKAAGHELVGLAWAAAEPSDVVTERAFEIITDKICHRLQDAGPVDAVYLDLHGAMVTEHLPDGEGEILRRVRQQIGLTVPLVASLDLHANVSPEMVAQADLLEIYRTYPHIDMAETGARCLPRLEAILADKLEKKAFRQIPFLLPLVAGCTMHEPARGLYAELARLGSEAGVALSFACGFPPADTPHAGPSVVAYADDQASADRLADAMVAAVMAQEPAANIPIFEPEPGVAKALADSQGAGKPVVLADTQDNPGAGGDGDTNGLLAELVRQRAKGAVIGLLADPESAALAHDLGEGATGRFRLGAKSGQEGHRPLEVEAKVVKLGDGKFTCTGPFYRGSRMQLGPMALLEIDGVLLVVSSKKTQAADKEMFRHLGVEPAEAPILGLKSSVHFRADFEPIAKAVHIVAAPGPNPVDHTKLDYKHLRAGVRLMPMSNRVS